MKDLINIFLMTVVVLGWAMLEVTGCGYAVLAIPVVYWLKPVLDLLHKNYWVGLAFWVHIPVENEHLFRFKMNADSGLRVHRFRTPQCTYSDVR